MTDKARLSVKGGKRPGAGRPRVDADAVKTSVSLPPDVAQAARAIGGGSLSRGIILAVRAARINVLHLETGAKVGRAVDNGRLVVEPAARPRYTLDALLAQCDPSAEPTPQGREWLNAPAVGDEVI